MRQRSETVRAALVAGVVAALAAGTVVWADGGDPDLVHSCVDSSVTTRANVTIVGPNDACPPGTSSVHLAKGETAVTREELADVLGSIDAEAIEPSEVEATLKPKANKRLYRPLGINLKNTKTVEKIVDEEVIGVPPSSVTLLGTASCPASHPYRVEGSHELIISKPTALPTLFTGENHDLPLGIHGLKSRHDVFRPGLFDGKSPVPKPLQLQITLECAKVKP